MHWDHEPRVCLTLTRNLTLTLRSSIKIKIRIKIKKSSAKSETGARFMERLGDSEIVHCGHEPLDESADKSEALQTLRAFGRVRGRRVSVCSACVLRAAFPRQAGIRWPGTLQGKSIGAPRIKSYGLRTERKRFETTLARGPEKVDKSGMRTSQNVTRRKFIQTTAAA